MPCSSSGPAACAAFPDAGSIGVFRSPGVCPSASLVTWVGFQPFPSFLCFSCSACLQGWPGLCALCQGAPVTVMSAWFEVKSPCYPSLTLGWVCFWPAFSQAFVVQVPDVFLYLNLGSSLSLPVLPASLRWLRFLLGCPPSVASLWRG